jgi:superfamily II DNA/RNA helicase
MSDSPEKLWLQNLNLNEFNAMQLAAFEKSKTEDNFMLLAPTGSGKTLAFLVPLALNLKIDTRGVQALVIAPTRELSLQIEQVFKQMKTGFTVCCCYGGHSMRIEQNNLSQNPAVVIATPGRLADHIQRSSFETQDIHTIVLDEFDKSLQMGFHEQLEVIFGAVKNTRQHILTSATSLTKLPSFLPFSKPAKLNFIKEKTNDKLELSAVHTIAAEKAETLMHLVQSFGQELCIVFCNHREAVERISTLLRQHHIDHSLMQGAMEQQDREINLIKFRGGATTLLIATDLAARGIDIPNIKHIVHYQLPPKEDAFIHRNGRTARMHADGQAYLILADDENLPEYMATTIKTIEVAPHTGSTTLPPNMCIYISAGKKQKISKGDIVGWLIQKGGINNQEIGQITIQDFASYVCIKRQSVKNILSKLNSEKLKKQKVRVDVAR